MMPTRSTTIAIINSDKDILEILDSLVQGAGFRSVTLDLKQVQNLQRSLEVLISQYNPELFLWDIGSPLRESIASLNQARAIELVRKMPFVVTTLYSERLSELESEVQHKIYDIYFLFENNNLRNTIESELNPQGPERR